MKKWSRIAVFGVIILLVIAGWYYYERKKNYEMEREIGPVRYVLTITSNRTGNYTLIAPLAIEWNEEKTHSIMYAIKPTYGSPRFRLVENIHGPAIEVKGNDTGFTLEVFSIRHWESEDYPRLSMANYTPPPNAVYPLNLYSYWVYFNSDILSGDIKLYIHLDVMHHSTGYQYRVTTKVDNTGWQIVEGRLGMLIIG